MGRLTVRRIAYALGAEITGVDFSRTPDAATVVEIREAWFEHLVLRFPNQNVSGDALVAFAGCFGEVKTNAQNFGSGTDPGNASITLLTNKRVVEGRPMSRYKSGQEWHTDLSYTDRPSPATFVLSKEIPDVGGDTMFANMYMAYETLSPAMQRLIEPLSAIHDWSATPNLGERGAEVVAEMQRKLPPVVHPLVRVHPETGRKALYTGGTWRSRQIVGMTEEESRPLLKFLNDHAVRYEFVYRHRWTANDLIMWDNRCLMHIALLDYDLQQTRHMLRCALVGPKSGYVYAGEDYVMRAPPVIERAVAVARG